MKSLVKCCAGRPDGRFRGRGEAQYTRRTPIVEAVEKTRDGIVTLRVTRSGDWAKPSSARASSLTNAATSSPTTTSSPTPARSWRRCRTRPPARRALQIEDPKHDLAILRLPVKKKLKALTFGPGSDLMVGETVIAIGNPYGYTNTVSTGIVSALAAKSPCPPARR